MSDARKPLSVIILIDALGWEIIRKFPFCEQSMPERTPLGTVLGYSSAAIPSLLSGEPPSKHGAWAMYSYSPERSPFKFLRYVPRLPHALEWRMRVLTRWITEKRKAVRGYYQLYDIPLRFLSYFDVAQRGDPYTPGGLSEETLFDRFVDAGVPYKLWTYRTPEAQNFAELKDSIGRDERVLFLYTAELDALMHREGVFDSTVREKLFEYQSHVDDIVERAREAGRDLSIYLFSDHGMTDVDRIVDIRNEVERWGYRTGSDLVAFYDSTMARFWCKPDLRKDLIERLNGTGWGRVVTDDELEAYGCFFEDRLYGDVIFLLSPGGLILPSFMGKDAVRAMHGYDPDDPFSKGVFMTNVQDSVMPRSILDLKRYLLDRVGV